MGEDENGITQIFMPHMCSKREHETRIRMQEEKSTNETRGSINSAVLAAETDLGEVEADDKESKPLLTLSRRYEV